MSSADPGVVMAKTSSDGEETSLCLLCLLFTNTDRSVQLLTPRLSAALRDYLRDNVRTLLSARGQDGFAC
ncbi:hypothetical protein DPMN_072312 [Dreissena polymorpha]|uniref:Uncharacterized protein n=1 Tax=Dreissena polymorpha TaxID=45954 RepID=A0A9D4BWS4_DREPO|nr:hypothetical protein DPMN_072312 [Dreissena polymorpha]